jgi:hypothetical protein
MKLIGGTALSTLAAASVPNALASTRQRSARSGNSAANPAARLAARLTHDDTAFLEEMTHRGCMYFWEQADAVSGQVLDRAANKVSNGAFDNDRRIASIAATGFGLAALCVADSRKYVPTAQIKTRVQATLQFHLNRMPHQHGFLFHFNDVRTGEPFGFSEVSSIDTAIFLCGALTCRAYFTDASSESKEIVQLASALYDRVDWPWMLNGGDTFAMGWRPASGFIHSRWNHYCELMMLYLLAIGAKANPVAPTSWDAFTRPPMVYDDFEYISGADPLFVHQYSHAFFDFAKKRDAYANYFQNSITATEAHKAFCLSLGRGYSDDYWGVTASDWEHGYTAWGGPPLMGPVNGSVVPCAAAGSLPFLPTECVQVLRALKDRFGVDAWGRYGFSDAFHPELLWYDPDVLGIDLGIGVLMAENLRTGLPWKTFMQNPEALAAMDLCGFQPE